VQPVAYLGVDTGHSGINTLKWSAAPTTQWNCVHKSVQPHALAASLCVHYNCFSPIESDQNKVHMHQGRIVKNQFADSVSQFFDHYLRGYRISMS